MWRKPPVQYDRRRATRSKDPLTTVGVDAHTQTEEDLFFLTAPYRTREIKEAEEKRHFGYEFNTISNDIGDILLSPILTFKNPSLTDSIKKKEIKAIDFHPTDPNLILSAFDDSYSSKSYPYSSLSPNPNLSLGSHPSPSPPPSSSFHSSSKSIDQVHVWHFHNQSKPLYTLTNENSINAILWDKQSSQTAFGGSFSGQILVWDLRSGNSPIQKSFSELQKNSGHKEKICQIQNLENENYSLIASVSSEGSLCLWNKRMLSKPLETIELRNPAIKKSSISSLTTFKVCPSSFSFSNFQNSNFYLGCESGQIYEGCVNEVSGKPKGLNLRFGRIENEKNYKKFQFNNLFSQGFENMKKFIQYEKSGMHKGFISSINSHHISKNDSDFDFSDLILTSSWDWTCKLWSSKIPSEPLCTFQESDIFLDAKWSPKNPSLFGALNGNGSIQLWDLNQQIHHPIAKSNFSSKNSSHFQLPINLAWSGDGCRLGVGDSLGLVHILTLSSALTLPSNDSNFFYSQIERMKNRIGNV